MNQRKTGEREYTPLSSFKVLPVYFTTLTHRKSFTALMKYLGTVFRNFFFLQFAVKMGLKKIEIIHVDHPLDDEVPFVPEKVDIYLDFINFWIRPLSFLEKRIGRKRASGYTAEYLGIIRRCYQSASRFYRFRMSTTRRPLDCTDRRFVMIRTLDPHYLCVPSLHVSIVVLAFSYFRRVFREIGLPEEEQAALNAELYAGAVSIAETVLYIKQHSTNCIPAALYMMSQLIPAMFSIEDSLEFMEHLFAESGDISGDKKELIRERLEFLFEQLLLEGCHEDDWLEPMRRWILKYQGCAGLALRNTTSL
ncbi:MAG: hypothetical protein LBR47_02565 [Spirochaetaceae bacterium]|jgi:hypothetical protein|nr:hypothetical protein [Spirochaetaceae bacterium]